MIRTAPAWIRICAGALLALILAVRLAVPAGFMPAFEHGRVAIVFCPDGGPPTSASHHHHKPAKTAHQLCPYATGSAAGLPDLGLVHSGKPPAPNAAVVPVRSFQLVIGEGDHRRPPLRGPPPAA